METTVKQNGYHGHATVYDLFCSKAKTQHLSVVALINKIKFGN
jgi:hypothetical protein